MLTKVIAELWCDFMHDAPMWPMHGHYECRTCGRRFEVPWMQGSENPRRSDLRVLSQAVAGSHR
jgi:hypothetical protein